MLFLFPAHGKVEAGVVMKNRMTWRETLSLTSMLFGMFFGAGNLIFPVAMGQVAGRNIAPALIGFLITGVGLPLLAVVSLGVTRSKGLLDLSSRIGRRYGYFFTCALYLTIGPFFAIPRCVTVPYEVGVAPLVPAGHERLGLFLFSLFFLCWLLFFSLKPGGIMTWIGKILNPLFLITMGILVLTALLHPFGAVSAVEPGGDYAAIPFAKGFLEGYNTMDTLAGLAFGIVIVDAIKRLGISDEGDVASSTVKAGTFSCLFMGLVYVLVAVMGAESRGALAVGANGGAALGEIARAYYPGFGAMLLAVIVFFCCLKTATGLVISISEAFVQMFPHSLSYRGWALSFSLFTFAIANIGLSGILTISLPVLMFLYPLAITLVLLAILSHFVALDRKVYVVVTTVTLLFALLDFFAALPASWQQAIHVVPLLDAAKAHVPLCALGLGWLVPALIAFVATVAVTGLKGRRERT